MKELLLVIGALSVVVLISLRMVRAAVVRRHTGRDRSPLSPAVAHYAAKADTPAAARQVLREMEQQAAHADAGTKAVLYVAAADIALTRLGRPSVAIHLYQRALRADPTSTEALTRLIELLWTEKKVRRIERLCWNTLARLGEDCVGGSAWRTCWEALASVYARTPRTAARQDAIRKLLAAWPEDADAETDSAFDEAPPCSVHPLEKKG